jgi:HD-GYP domain-containing protein (c-di-GMP phosphodiesterase class II)
MREHVNIGVRILEPMPGFRDIMPIIAQHHEWFNGSGYPQGLAGENIDLHARILTVADCYDALVSDRPYRKGLTAQEAIQLLQRTSGTQFDPQIIKVFMQLFSQPEP